MQQRTTDQPDAQSINASGAVLLIAVGALVLHLALRGWLLWHSFFYADDFRLLHEARTSPVTGDALLEPFDNQFMPLGRGIAFLVESSGPLNHHVAAVTSLVLLTIAGTGVLVMLVTLFGARWAILVPYAVYLTSAVPMSATMWWAASLNALPLQAIFGWTVAAWVLHLRTGRRGWLAASMLLVVIGLLSYVKTVFLLPLLLLVMLLWFGRGGPVESVVHCWRHHRTAATSVLALGSIFTAYYIVLVPRDGLSGSGSPELGNLAVSLAREMVVETVVPGLFGGPWDWWVFAPPPSVASAPVALIVGSWVALGILVAVLAIRRTRVWCAVVLVALHLVLCYAMLLVTRATMVDAIAGTEYRYVADLLPVAALALGLATMELRGAPNSGERRRPVPHRPSRRAVLPVVAATVAVAGGGIWSTVTYAQPWHHDNRAEQYVANVRADLASQGRTDFADHWVPADVISWLHHPANTLRGLMPLVAPDAVSFPAASSRLRVLDDAGHLRIATVEGTTSVPGTDPGCGWLIQGAGRVPLEAVTPDYPWWAQISYVATDRSDVTVSGGRSRVRTSINAGLGTVWVRLEGAIEAIDFSGLAPDVALCVDVIHVGTPSPGDSP